jgi:hypothetical protein
MPRRSTTSHTATATPATPEPAPAPTLEATMTVADSFQARVDALIDLLEQGESAIADALRRGIFRIQGSRQPRVKMHAKAEVQPFQAHPGRKCLVFHIQLRHTARVTGH